MYIHFFLVNLKKEKISCHIKTFFPQETEVVTVEDPPLSPSPPPRASPPPAAARVRRYFDLDPSDTRYFVPSATDTDTEDEEEVEECYGVRSRKRRRSSTETQRSLWDSDEESGEQRRQREADL